METGRPVRLVDDDNNRRSPSSIAGGRSAMINNRPPDQWAEGREQGDRHTASIDSQKTKRRSGGELAIANRWKEGVGKMDTPQCKGDR